MEDKYSQGEDSSLRKCVVIQVKCYDGFTKGSLLSDSENILPSEWQVKQAEY